MLRSPKFFACGGHLPGQKIFHNYCLKPQIPNGLNYQIATLVHCAAKILVKIFRLRQTTSDITLFWPLATLFAVFKTVEICERSERATENKKSVSEEILNFLDVGSHAVGVSRPI